MKKLFFLLTLSFTLITLTHLNGFSQTITFSMNDVEQHNHNDVNGFKHRIPPRPITVTIDFEANELTFTPQLEEIDSYEIWDEGEERLISVSYDSIDFINNLSSANGNVVIVINTPDRSYKGYFSISNPN